MIPLRSVPDISESFLFGAEVPLARELDICGACSTNSRSSGTHSSPLPQAEQLETTFSMIKGKFGDSLRSKSDTGQINEVQFQDRHAQPPCAD
jgi:hypothetical protein